jgi:hypothetical protein
MCTTDVEILQRYDPDGEGWQSELLRPEEFARMMHVMYQSRGLRLWELGDYSQARSYFAEAIALHKKYRVASVRTRAAISCPRLCLMLLRLRKLGWKTVQ